MPDDQNRKTSPAHAEGDHGDKTHAAFIESIQELKREMNLTVVFVTHDLRAVSAISDRIACLNLTLHYHDVPEHPIYCRFCTF